MIILFLNAIIDRKLYVKLAATSYEKDNVGQTWPKVIWQITYIWVECDQSRHIKKAALATFNPRVVKILSIFTMIER